MHNRREEKPQRYMKESSVLCKHCGRSIIADNYLIHQARCALMSSRARHPEEMEKEESIHSQPHSNSSNFRKQQPRKEERGSPSQLRNSNRERSKIFQNKPPSMQQEIQKIPCHFCGYPQTLSELDTHPKQCEHRQQECIQCGNKFPRSLIPQHHQICRINSRHNHENHHQERWRNWENEQESDEEGYNPFGNFSSMFMGARRPHHHVHRHPQQNPFHQQTITVIDRNNGRGQVQRQFVINQSPGFMRESREPGLNFRNFFALLELMALRNGRLQNQGLTKDQIKNLKRYKYQGNNASKKQGEKDMCTICYCEFEKDQKLVELKCKHSYHQECITKWVQKTAKCPVCKAPQTNRPIFEQEEGM